MGGAGLAAVDQLRNRLRRLLVRLAGLRGLSYNTLWTVSQSGRATINPGMGWWTYEPNLPSRGRTQSAFSWRPFRIEMGTSLGRCFAAGAFRPDGNAGARISRKRASARHLNRLITALHHSISPQNYLTRMTSFI